MSDPNDTRQLDEDRPQPLETQVLESLEAGRELAIYKSPVPDRLRVILPDKTERIFNALYPQLVIGRRTKANQGQIDIDMSPFDADIQGVSRFHAAIVPNERGLVLRDMQSTNGTHLNGIKLTPARSYQLGSGDLIKVGNLKLEVYFEFGD